MVLKSVAEGSRHSERLKESDVRPQTGISYAFPASPGATPASDLQGALLPSASVKRLAEPALHPVRKGKVGAPPEARKVLCNHRGAEVLGALKMPDYLGADQRKTKEDEKDDKPIRGQLTQPGAPGRVRTSLGPAWGEGSGFQVGALTPLCSW